jgi:hypothetical protein
MVSGQMLNEFIVGKDLWRNEPALSFLSQGFLEKMRRSSSGKHDQRPRIVNALKLGSYFIENAVFG